MLENSIYCQTIATWCISICKKFLCNHNKKPQNKQTFNHRLKLHCNFGKRPLTAFPIWELQINENIQETIVYTVRSISFPLFWFFLLLLWAFIPEFITRKLSCSHLAMSPWHLTIKPESRLGADLCHKHWGTLCVQSTVEHPKGQKVIYITLSYSGTCHKSADYRLPHTLERLVCSI